jgi:small multidrug resistance family-3 protein
MVQSLVMGPDYTGQSAKEKRISPGKGGNFRRKFGGGTVRCSQAGSGVGMAVWLYLLAAGMEIAGCFAVWAWWRGASALWLLPGAAALGVFALALALTPPAFAGRSFAAYGGVYIAASLVWLWLVEGTRPGQADLLGAGLALAGAAVILWAPRLG